MRQRRTTRYAIRKHGPRNLVSLRASYVNAAELHLALTELIREVLSFNIDGDIDPGELTPNRRSHWFCCGIAADLFFILSMISGPEVVLYDWMA